MLSITAPASKLTKLRAGSRLLGDTRNIIVITMKDKYHLRDMIETIL